MVDKVQEACVPVPEDRAGDQELGLLSSRDHSTNARQGAWTLWSRDSHLSTPPASSSGPVMGAPRGDTGAGGGGEGALKAVGGREGALDSESKLVTPGPREGGRGRPHGYPRGQQ